MYDDYKVNGDTLYTIL